MTVAVAAARRWPPRSCWSRCPTQSPLWLSIASVVALACGWAAARIVYTELAQSRREAAADRAAQAQAYRIMFAERAVRARRVHHRDDRPAIRRDRDVAALEDDVVAAEQRAIEAEARVQREARRANDAQERLVTLTERVQELEIRKAEQADELATWHAEVDVDAVSTSSPGRSGSRPARSWPAPEQKHA